MNRDIYFIAEIGLNHNGDISLALEMIKAAQDSGASAVKFQSITADKLVSPKTFSQKIDGFGLNGVFSMGDFWKRVSINSEFHSHVKSYCDKLGIEFMSTPFDFDSVELLNSLGVSRYKIASGDITHYPLLQKVAKLGKPIILSTGASTIGEIESAVNYIKACGNSQISLLHCVSLYPTQSKFANLNAIPHLYEKFGLPVGYSDHTIGFNIPIAAIAKGAVIIEKHFTLDKNLPGPDQKISADPGEFKKIVQMGNEVAAALGIKGKDISEEETRMRPLMRRSIVAKRKLKIGHVINLNDIDFKRPGDGISPTEAGLIVGKKLISEIEKDIQIKLDNLE